MIEGKKLGLVGWVVVCYFGWGAVELCGIKYEKRIEIVVVDCNNIIEFN